MEHLFVDVSSADVLQVQACEQGSPSPTGRNVVRAWATADWHTGSGGAGATTTIRSEAQGAAVMPAAVQVLQHARVQATPSMYQPALPMAVVGMEVVQAGAQTQYAFCVVSIEHHMRLRVVKCPGVRWIQSGRPSAMSCFAIFFLMVDCEPPL